jgi:hypothetical protein
MNTEKNDESLVTEEKLKIGWDDILAIMIAQFQILFPLVIGFVVIIALVLIFLMKVWLKH